jgi:PAS domain S-box-containing protein
MQHEGTYLEPFRYINSQEAYLSLLNAMPVMLWTADAEGHWQHVNTRWAEYTGMVGEARGFGFEEALHPDDVAPTLRRWRQSIDSGETYEIEYRLRDRSGNYRCFLIRGVRVTSDLGEGVAWVGTCTDIEPQKRAEQEARLAQEAAVAALGIVLEARDRETHGHTARVALQAVRVGEHLQLAPEQLQELRLGATLHDLGKITIPDSILLKPGPLTLEERQEMEGHALEGEQLVRKLGFIPPSVLQLVRHHHERWDGQGYPDHLQGEDIPLLARIFSVIDVSDALLNERPYKRAWTVAETVAELRAQAGHQLDPQIALLFAGILQEQSEEDSDPGH